VDVSLVNDADFIHDDVADSNFGRIIESNAKSNAKSNIDIKIDSNDNEEMTNYKQHRKYYTSEVTVPVDSTKNLMFDHLSCLSSSPHTSSIIHDSPVMTKINKRLFREGLADDDKKEIYENVPCIAAPGAGVLEKPMPKGNKMTTNATKLSGAVLLGIGVVFLIGLSNNRSGELNTGAASSTTIYSNQSQPPNATTITEGAPNSGKNSHKEGDGVGIEISANKTELPLVCDGELCNFANDDYKISLKESLKESFKSQVQDNIFSQRADHKQIMVDKKNNNDHKEQLWDTSLNHHLHFDNSSHVSMNCNCSLNGNPQNNPLEYNMLHEFWAWLMPLVLILCYELVLRSGVVSCFSLMKSKQKLPLRSPIKSSVSRQEPRILNPPSSRKKRAVEPAGLVTPCIDLSVYEAMALIEIQELLRRRKCKFAGDTKEQLINVLVQSYHDELACMTIKKLRPKLRELSLTQSGTKKDLVRRLVEAGL